MCPSIATRWVSIAFTSCLISTGLSIAYLLEPDDGTCMLAQPCPCSATELTCFDAGLLHIPPILVSLANPPAMTNMDIVFSYNNITEIDANAFVNLTLTGVSMISIYLYNNRINRIHDNAFKGIEDAIVHLALSDNYLTSIPVALGALTNLTTLELYNNPLHSLASSAIYNLGRTVTSLYVSLDLFAAWPTELQYFQLLDMLYIRGYPLHTIPLNGMTGFESTLTVLSITNSRLDAIPSAVCHLKALHTLHYANNPQTKVPIFEPCNHTMDTVTRLDLSNNSLGTFPDILGMFGSLTDLYLDHNHILVVNPRLVPVGYPLLRLSMSHNGLRRIPSAILHLQMLHTLDVSYNDITTLEDNDFVGLSHLMSIDAHDNPLVFVTANAFQSQTHLDYLGLHDTQLHTIPRAVTSLAISYIRLQNTPIECTCKLSYLTTWYSNRTTIGGTCANTGESLAEYLGQYLPKCQ